MLQAALENARFGFQVYPARPRGKQPLHRGWQRAATTDQALLIDAWEKEPQANVGVLCGRGVVVLDADSKWGVEALSDLDLPLTTAVRTARGEHRYFAGSARSIRDLLPDVELRGIGAGVLGAGSLHPSGTSYEWVIPPWEVDPAPMPDILRELLRAKAPALDWVPEPSPIQRGSRNNTLTRIAGSLRGRSGINDQALAGALLAINTEQCDPPLLEAEVVRIARSAGRWTAPPPWIAEPAAFVRDRRLPARARFVLRVLCDHAKDDGTCHPGIRRLSALTSFAKDTVQGAIDELEEAGRVSAKRSRGGNRYRILPWSNSGQTIGEKHGSSVLDGRTVAEAAARDGSRGSP